MKLNKLERLQLINQYKILKALSGNKREIEQYELFIKILDEGLVGLYDEFLGEYDEESTDGDYIYTRDVLSLHSQLMFSYKDRGIENDKLEYLIQFKGFDLNDATQIPYLKYTEVLMFYMDRYRTLKELCGIKRESDLNSHGREINKEAMDKYLYNYNQIKKTKNPTELYTEEEMKQIFEI